MALSDKTLSCVECGNSFTFTVGEQEFFTSRGYTNEPKRCPNCRENRRSEQRTFRQGPREMHPAVLRSVWKPTTMVPFRPRGGPACVLQRLL